LSAASPASTLRPRRIAADLDPARAPSTAPKLAVSELELREESLGVRARELSLTLGTLLILAGILVALIAALTATATIGPIGLIGGGIALLRFGGRRPERLGP
jgi:hypothetical protein